MWLVFISGHDGPSFSPCPWPQPYPNSNKEKWFSGTARRAGPDHRHICMDNKISPIRQDKLCGRLVWTANFLKCFSFLGYGYFLQISLSEITFLSNQLVALGLLTFISPIWKTNEAGRITIWDPNQKCCLFFWKLDFKLIYFPLKAPPAIHWIALLQGKPAAWPKVFVGILSVVKWRQKKRAKLSVKMNTDVAATTGLKDQVRSLGVASKDSSAQIWPKKV